MLGSFRLEPRPPTSRAIRRGTTIYRVGARMESKIAEMTQVLRELRSTPDAAERANLLRSVAKRPDLLWLVHAIPQSEDATHRLGEE